MCKFCDANSKGEILSSKPIRTFEWQKTAGYRPPKDKIDFLEMFILKNEDDKKAGLMVDSGYGYRWVDIDYCPFCRKEVGRVIHITLKEMLEEIVQCILEQKEIKDYYWKDGEGEFRRITEIDLLDRIRTSNDDFTEFEWELEESRLYKVQYGRRSHMTNEQRVRVDRLERYLITDREKTYTTVRVNDLDTALSLIKEQQEREELIKEYVHQEIVHYTETIEDYEDDDKKENKDYIGQLKEEREHWKDIEKILQNKPKEELYMNWWRYGLYE